MQVNANFDPLLAKLIVHRPTMEEAVSECRRFLSQFHISGPGLTSNMPELAALLALLEDPRLARTLSTRFVGDHEAAIKLAAEAAADVRRAREEEVFGGSGAASAGDGGARPVKARDMSGLEEPTDDSHVGVYSTGSGECVSLFVR